MIFEKKKLNTETLSEYLKEVRQRLNLDLRTVAEKTAIQPKFLEALEDGNFKKLPPDVYVLGFLRQLSALYGVEAEVLIEQYRKEKTIHTHIVKQREGAQPWSKKVFGGIVINPKTVSLGTGVLFVVVTLGYLIWAVSSINRAPSLEVFQPEDRQVIKGSSVTIRGKTDPGMTVTVNQQNIFVDSQGNFQSQMGVNAGFKELVITAKNKFDKSVTKTITVIGEDEARIAESVAVKLKLEFSSDVALTYVIDDLEPRTEEFRGGEVAELTGKGKISVSTSNAGATKVFLNGRSLGVMGRAGEKLENVPFFPEDVNINNPETK